MGQDASPPPQPPAAAGTLTTGAPPRDSDSASSQKTASGQGAPEDAGHASTNGASNGAGGEGVGDWEPALNATPLLPPREPLGARVAALMGRHHTPLIVLCVALLWCIVALPPLSPPENLKPGQMAPHDILAPYATMLLDRGETTRRQAEAEAVPPAYEHDFGTADRAYLRLRALIEAVRSTQRLAARLPKAASAPTKDTVPKSLASATAARDARAQRAQARWARIMSQQQGEEIPPALLRSLSVVGVSVAASKSASTRATPDAPLGEPAASGQSASQSLDNERKRGVSDAAAPASTWRPGDERWALIERAAQDGVRAVYAGSVRADVEDDTERAHARIAASVATSQKKWPLGTDDARAATELARYSAREPNLIVDAAATQRAREEASANVRQVFVRVQAGEPLARAGEVISREQWSQLQDFGLAKPRLDARTMLAQALLCAFLVGLCAVFVSRLHPRLLENPTLLWLCAAIPLVFLLFLRYTLRAPHAENVAIPLAATAAMLITVLADARMGILAGFVVAMVGAVMARSDLSLFVCAALLSWTGAMGVSGLASRGHLLRAGVLMAAAGAAMHALLGLMRQDSWASVLSMSAWGVASGALSILAMAALAMLLERPFGITTHLRLLELLSPDESVLQRMLHEAPGTYTHSMTVAQLSEAAAKATGNADAMLCRAGGMYHDIGKLRRPFCFVENQTGDNVHDRIAPALSALVIAAHVRDGLEAGRGMRLPTPILDIIAQHHGTSLISFFYEKARAQSPGTEIDEAKFRYPGPKPQSKEAAIVMLADAVEASSRALPDASPPKLRAHIHAMIQARLREGELSHSDLTMGDLETIEDAFARVLSGVLHGRIAYPSRADLERDLREAALGRAAEPAVSLSKERRSKARPARAPRAPRPQRPSKVQAALQATREAEQSAAPASAPSTSTCKAPQAANASVHNGAAARSAGTSDTRAGGRPASRSERQ